MRTQQIQIDSIIFPSDDVALRPRPNEEDKDYDKYLELKDSIGETGLINFFSVSETDDGQFTVIDGTRRAHAVIELNNEGCEKFADGTVWVQVREEKDWDALALQIAGNYNTKKTMSSQEIKAIKKLIAIQGWDVETAAKKIGRSKSHLTNLLKLNDLSDIAKEALDAKELSIVNAIQLQKLPEDSLTDVWIADAIALPADQFASKVSEELNAIRKARQEGSAGKREFVAQAKVMSKDDLNVLREQAMSAFEIDPNDYTRGCKETMEKVFSLDEETLSLKREEWEQKEAKRKEEDAKRKENREAKKLSDAQAFLEKAGKKVIDA